VAAITASLDGGFTPLVAQLGPQHDSDPQPVPADEATWAGLVNNAWILGAIVLLLVVGLAWGLYRASQRMDEMNPR
jgi:hypothetical protein